MDSVKYNLLLGQRYVERTYSVPRAGGESYIEALSRAVKKEGVDVIIPSPDPEVLAVSKHRASSRP